MRAIVLLLLVPLTLGGCVAETIAKTAVSAVTLPVKVVSAGANAVLPSQKRADEKRGREMRKEDEERGKLIRLAEERCRKGKPLPTDNCAALEPR